MLFFASREKKKAEARLGYAADFCPVCRRIAAFEVYVGAPSHLHSPGEDGEDFPGHAQRCLVCLIEMTSEPVTFHRLAETEEPVERLLEATQPRATERYARRLEQEKQVAVDPHGLDAVERRALLMEAFRVAAVYFSSRTDKEDEAAGRRLLVLALRPLKPGMEEVRACLRHFREARQKIGMLSTAELHHAATYTPERRPFDY